MGETAFPWFDRSDLLHLLLKRVEGFEAGYRQNLALLGPEGIGKTTLLRRLLQERLAHRSSCLVCYVDLKLEDTFADWVERFVQALLAQALKVKSTQELPRSRGLGERLLARADQGSADEVFAELWDLPYLITQETGLPIVLVVDEFHRLRALELRDPFRQLGGRIMVQGNVLYLLVSSEVELARRILREGLSLLFGQFEVVEVNPLDPGVCFKAIGQQCGELSARSLIAYLVVELAQGYPNSLHLLMKGLSCQSSGAHEGFLSWLESLFLEPDGILRNRFEGRLGQLKPQRDRRILIQILTAMAGGTHRLPQVAQAIGRPVAHVSAAARVLVQTGWVVKEGLFYRIPDRLFELWIRTAYPIIQRGGFLDLETRRSFQDAVSAWMTQIHQALGQPIEEQALRLVRQWGGEWFEVDGKRIRLPSFDRVEMIAGPSGHRVIVAHQIQKGGKGWLITPIGGALEEPQARSLVMALRESPFAHYRKVLMGPEPVEINARLILQEAAVPLWDLTVMNRLLNLYGMPRMAPLKEAPSLWAETIPIGRDIDEMKSL